MNNVIHTIIMKNISRFLLAIVALLAISTSCSDDYGDVKPGEVVLEGNDYRNEKKLQAITVAPAATGAEGTAAEPIRMSTLELRTLWRSVIIRTEKQLEYATDTEKRLYASPKEVEEEFFLQMAQNMALLKEAYPLQYQAVVDELVRADVHVFAHYVWCAQSDEYIKLMFRATPSIEAATPPAEEPDATPIE